ncbi:MAG: C10 family peptidase [Prevotellaceae bacterium]|nr:C10 family peptidase [Prevotellaceae bacterium]
METFAKDRTEAEMLGIAKNVFDSSTAMKAKSRGASETIELTRLSSTDELSVYGASGYGFVIISHDDSFKAVLGYSDTDYDENNMPCGFRWWIGAMDKSLSAMKTCGKTSSSLSASPSSSTGTYLMTTTWSQESPYYNQCPTIGLTRASTGCIATAMAQIMNYYEYPESGIGYGEYSVTNTAGTTTSYTDQAINGTYDWDNMLDSYTMGWTSEQASAVSTLMFDAGKASKMQYASDASGAYDYDAATGFCLNFQYDSLALGYYYRNLYSDDEWMEMVNTALSDNQPILYCGSDSEYGGHAFVLDGIDSDGLVHVNWGWAGYYNGWYSIDDLNPYSDVNFTEYQSMVTGYKTQSTPDEDEENTSIWGTTEGYSFSVSRNSLTASLTDLYNFCFRVFKGTLAIILEDVANNGTNNVEIIIHEEEDGIYTNWGFYGIGDVNLSQYVRSLSAGTYRAYVASKSTDESSYKCVRGVGGEIFYTVTVDSNGSISVVEGDTTSGISGVTTDKSSVSDGIVRVYDLSGKLISKSSSSSELELPSESGVVIVKDGDSTKKVIIK